MARRKGKAATGPDLGPVEAPRAYDGRGNVRPADDRFLTEFQVEARDAYLETVEDTSNSLPDPEPETDPNQPMLPEE